ncbi:Uncharacterised protein [Salmonella enterica subsp. enterica serovar Bovismorbificans]|nr:Uncharacterised protein [Salmonella enterica subsp. enterica serovar Bovismorbificans]
MQNVVIIGKTHQLAVRAKYMDVAAAAQRAGSIRRSNIHRIEVSHASRRCNNAPAVVEIVMPRLIRVFGAMNKHIVIVGRMHRHHTDMRALRGAINHLHVAGMHIDALNGLARK